IRRTITDALRRRKDAHQGWENSHNSIAEIGGNRRGLPFALRSRVFPIEEVQILIAIRSENALLEAYGVVDHRSNSCGIYGVVLLIPRDVRVGVIAYSGAVE